MNPDVVWDGIFGALIGSLVTTGAVVATIRHDSKQRRSDRLDETVGVAHAATQAWGVSVAARGPLDSTSNQLMGQALQATIGVIARAKRTEPQLAALVDAASTDLTNEMQGVSRGAKQAPALTASIQRLSTALGCWFSEPDDIRNGNLDLPAIHERLERATRRA